MALTSINSAPLQKEKIAGANAKKNLVMKLMAARRQQGAVQPMPPQGVTPPMPQQGATTPAQNALMAAVARRRAK